MNKDEWKELGLQCLMGALYGAAGGILATEEWNLRVFAIVGIAALKGAAHVVLNYMDKKGEITPSTGTKSIKNPAFKPKETWVKKAKRII